MQKSLVANSGGSNTVDGWTPFTIVRPSSGNSGRSCTAYGIISRIPDNSPKRLHSPLNGWVPFRVNGKADASKEIIYYHKKILLSSGRIQTRSLLAAGASICIRPMVCIVRFRVAISGIAKAFIRFHTDVCTVGISAIFFWPDVSSVPLTLPLLPHV